MRRNSKNRGAPACHTTPGRGSNGPGRPLWRQTAQQLPRPVPSHTVCCAWRAAAVQRQRVRVSIEQELAGAGPGELACIGRQGIYTLVAGGEVGQKSSSYMDGNEQRWHANAECRIARQNLY